MASANRPEWQGRCKLVAWQPHMRPKVQDSVDARIWLLGKVTTLCLQSNGEVAFQGGHTITIYTRI